MLILHKTVGSKGIFYIDNQEKQLAELAYTMPASDKMIIEHTEVDDSLRGQNVGFELVSRAVEFARQEHIRIIPVCPFAKSVFDKNEAFRDVL